MSIDTLFENTNTTKTVGPQQVWGTSTMSYNMQKCSWAGRPAFVGFIGSENAPPTEERQVLIVAENPTITDSGVPGAFEAFVANVTGSLAFVGDDSNPVTRSVVVRNSAAETPLDQIPCLRMPGGMHFEAVPGKNRQGDDFVTKAITGRYGNGYLNVSRTRAGSVQATLLTRCWRTSPVKDRPRNNEGTPQSSPNHTVVGDDIPL